MQTALPVIPHYSARFFSVRIRARIGVALILSAIVASCTTPPPPPPENRAQIIQRDGRVGLGLAPQFEAQLNFRHDTQVSAYLRQLAEKLMSTQPEFQGATVGVFVIKEGRDVKWEDFGLPGIRIYLSSEILKQAEYENQVAAAISMELAYVLRREVIQRVDQIQAAGGAAPSAGDAAKPVDYTGPKGIFNFAEASRIAAIDVAVDILYKAGFDPRGVIELWKIYEDHPNRSPFDPAMLQRLTDESRTAVSSYSPLRNPIVKSARFTVIQERIRRL